MMDKNSLSPVLIVNLAAGTGPVRHSASGFLYGLGNQDIPSANLLAPLRPQVAAQKPEGGLQHPNGDAFDVSDNYRAAGGREIEIYIQDLYPSWPYDPLGLEDYLAKVEMVTRQVAAHSNRELFSLVPLNEPDQIWYNLTDRRQALLADWQALYERIKSIYPAARIVGPNFARYDSSFYRDFMTFARDRACLPEVVSWHELNDDFFSGWEERYQDYRAIERSLGLAPREICINEYARITGELGIPGRLIQWVARFEHSKVDACLAYWTDAGSLNNLGTRDNYNQATGGWWLYRWYGGLSGETVTVTPPDPKAEGLQGIAALDSQKQQARVLFGGGSGPAEVVIRGFETAPYFGNRIHLALWEVESSGLAESAGPRLLLEEQQPVENGAVTLKVAELNATSVYQLLAAPAGPRPFAGKLDLQPVETADLAGGARLVYGGAAPFVTLPYEDAGVTFVVNAGQNDFYEVGVICRAAQETVGQGPLRVRLNGENLTSLPAAQGESWTRVHLNLFLTAGINRIAFEGAGGQIAGLELKPGHGWVQGYEAEAPGNLLKGTATVFTSAAASGGQFVGKIGNGSENSLIFSAVTVPEDGTYRMVVHYANAEFRGGHSYNSQVVDRWAEIRVNSGAPCKVYFRNTFAWDHFQTRVVDVNLRAGANMIEFSNPAPGCFVPHIDRIEIAALMG